MQLILIGVVLIISIAVIFSLQNAAMVSVTFLVWHFELSLALLLLTSFVLGLGASLLASIPSWLRKNRLIADQRQSLKELGNSIVKDEELMKPTKFVH